MSKEQQGASINGWLMLVVIIAGFVLSTFMFVMSVIRMDSYGMYGSFGINPLIGLIASSIAWVVLGIMCNGFFTVQPNQARVCVLFGDYKGTVREEGFRWANPFYSRDLGMTSDTETGNADPNTNGKIRHGHNHGSMISLRLRTLNGDTLKVNDKMGNPIEIATVVVWRVADTAKALFDVDDYESYVSMQIETALRHVASVYAYDHMEDDDLSPNAITLRTNIEEVSDSLKAELSLRLRPAGCVVEDARLTHLAYSPEIAQAMLRRQQAEAVIAARKKIVEGAVSMVDMALKQLSRDGVVEFDDDRKAIMASNLMVVLCGESEAQPVVNTGTLYQ